MTVSIRISREYSVRKRVFIVAQFLAGGISERAANQLAVEFGDAVSSLNKIRNGSG